jgi:hypothetical protein
VDVGVHDLKIVGLAMHLEVRGIERECVRAATNQRNIVS